MKLELDRVSVRFGGVRALNHVCLTVERGEVRGLVGPNGSGKTTLLNATSGMVSIQDGQVSFDGWRVESWPPHRRAQFGLGRTFQATASFADGTVQESVLIGLHKSDPQTFWKACVPGLSERLAADNARRTLDLLARVDLADLALVPVGALSYGKRRLLDLARALAGNPSLLLLDEPVAGLSDTEIAVVEQVLRDLRARGVTILLVEHHMAFVMSLSDRVTVMDYGSPIAEGTPEQVSADSRVLRAYLGGDIP